ncbi:hypothetical protein MTO96_051571, partial [Rhipicephalus appendiculatus]
LSQPITTSNSSSGEVNDAKPSLAVVDRNASCTAASSIPACDSADDKLPHNRFDAECNGGGGHAVTLAALKKRHADPTIRQPGKAHIDGCDGASASRSSQPYLTTRGRGTLRLVSHQEPDRQQRKPVAESLRNDLCSDRTDAANAKPSSSRQHQTIPSPRTKLIAASPKRWKRLPRSSEARHDRPAAATVAAGTSHVYALHLRTCCPSLPPVDDIAKRLEKIQILFQREGLSTETPCSMTETEPCWILNSLRTFNRILVRADIELKEEEPRKFVVCSLDKDGMAHSEANGIFDASILLHLLLERHKCVQTLHLDKTAIASSFPEILCDALACNRGLRHLAIACHNFLPGTECALVHSLCKMPALETIDIFKLPIGPSSAARIGDMVARTESVRRIKFLENGMRPTAGTELMQGLCCNRSLELIWLGYNALGIGGARFLGEYLATSSNLRDLSLSNVPCFDEEQLILIAEGLKTNRSLVKLKIHNCHVTPAGIDRLAEVLKTNSTLKNLAVSACNLAQAEAKSLAILLEFNAGLLEVDLWHNIINDFGAVRLATALKFNTHLETLNLEANRITSQGVLSLVEALASNKILKELRLGSFAGQDEDAVRTALIRTAAHGLVRLCYNRLSGVFQLSESLRINADRITSVHLDTSVNVNAACLKELFVSLATVSCLESLCIESQIKMDGSAARRFAKLLSKTKTLKHIQMNSCNANSEALETVMWGLKKNQSVSHMEMEFSAIRSSCTDAFVDMLKGNKTLTHFGYITTKVSELQVIARALRVNRVLTSLKIWEEPGFEEAVFEIDEILRRNVSYVNRAVEFALDPKKFGIERHPAEIFEVLCDTQTFQNHLARVAGPGRASEAMRNARRHITTNLFAIAGVCQIPVTCWPHPEGATQMDSLNMLCWMNIFAHLKVTDIPCSSTDC